MKRFVFLSLGVLCLAVVAANTQAQSTEGFQFFALEYGNNNKLLAIDQNGNGFLQGGVRDAQLTNPPEALGNFWGNGLQPQGVQYLVFYMTAPGDPGQQLIRESIIAILQNGEIWSQNAQGPWSQPPVLAGNFWGNPTSTSKSTWGGVKGQFKK